jgi:hypothetical protein
VSLPQDIIRNYDSLKLERGNLDNIIQDVIDYIRPFYKDVVRLRSQGQRRTNKQHDSTATYGSFVLSQFIQGAACNPSTRWFGLAHRDEAKNEIQEVATCFKHWTTAMLLSLRQSNFYQGNGQSINAWVDMGTGPLLCESVPQTREGLSQFRFTSIPFGSYVLCEGPDGAIDTFIRMEKIAAINAVKMFGEEKDKYGNYGVSDTILKAARGKDAYQKFEFLHAIQPRENIGYSSKATKGQIKTAKEMPWASCWVEVAKTRLVRESGYRLFPVAIPRYDLISGEAYGHGPSEMVLADARTRNEATKKQHLLWDRQLDPPTLSRRNSIINGVLNKRAGGDTVVTDVDRSVKQLFDQPNLQFDDRMHERTNETILRMYHVNEILNLLTREKPEMTAFETNARLALLQQIQGPVFGRLEQDYLATIVNVHLDNMAHAGMLEPPPEEIQINPGESGFGVLSVSYEGPLARAQRNQEIIDIQQSIADVGGVGQFDPQVFQLVDFKKVTRKLFEIRGTQDMLITEEEFTAKMAELIKQQNAEKATTVMAGGAEALGKVAPFLKVAREGAQGAAA